MAATATEPRLPSGLYMRSSCCRACCGAGWTAGRSAGLFLDAVPEPRTVHRLDLQDEAALHKFFSGAKAFDHLAIFQSMGVQGVQWELDTASAQSAFERIFWFPFMAAKRGGAYLHENGSIVFVCASSTRRPMKGMSVVGAANGAVEALAANLAVEMAPRRANVINPGLYLQASQAEEVDTVKAGKVGNVVSGLLAPGVDQAQNIGRAVLHLMSDNGITGSVVDAAILMRGCCTADVTGWVTIGGC